MEPIGNSVVAVVVHPEHALGVHSSQEGAEGVQHQSHSAARLAVNGVHVVLQAGSRAHAGTALAGLLLLSYAGGHLGMIRRH